MTDDPGMNPLHDAKGKFITAAVNLEVVITIVASGLSGKNYEETERLAIDKRLKILVAAASDLPPQLGRRLESAVEVIKELFDLRNGVVHGIGMVDVEGAVISKRPSRKRSAPQESVTTRYDRVRLIGEGRRCNEVREFLWNGFQTWPQFNVEGEDSRQ